MCGLFLVSALASRFIDLKANAVPLLPHHLYGIHQGHSPDLPIEKVCISETERLGFNWRLENSKYQCDAH